MENCVTTSSLGLLHRGILSTRGRSEITTPAAWVDEWRFRPSSARERSRSFLIRGLFFCLFLKPGFPFNGIIEFDVEYIGNQFGDAIHLAIGDIQRPCRHPE